MKVGKNYKDDLTFAVANGDDFGSLLSDAGLSSPSASSDPPVVLIQDDQGKKYVMEEKFE